VNYYRKRHTRTYRYIYIYVICNICYRHILYVRISSSRATFIAVKYIRVYNNIIQANNNNNNNNVMTNDDDDNDDGDNNNNNNNWYFEVKTHASVMWCQRQRLRRKASGFFTVLQIYSSPNTHTHTYIYQPTTWVAVNKKKFRLSEDCHRSSGVCCTAIEMSNEYYTPSPCGVYHAYYNPIEMAILLLLLGSYTLYCVGIRRVCNNIILY